MSNAKVKEVLGGQHMNVMLLVLVHLLQWETSETFVFLHCKYKIVFISNAVS